MSENYCQFSFFVEIKDQAQAVEQTLNEFKEGIESGYVQYEIDEHGLWVYADEFGDVEYAAQLTQVLIKKFDLNPVGFQWAETCSKPQVDSFGGGACVVSKDEIAIKTTYEMMVDLQSYFAHIPPQIQSWSPVCIQRMDAL